MGHLFSRKKPSRVTEQDKAILELKFTRDQIKQYQKRSDDILEKDKIIAKKLLQEKKKERAILLLRKKRFIEQKLQEAGCQLDQIEKMIQELEFSQIQMKVADTLKVGNESLKFINSLINIEDIEKILEETQEAAEKQKEITELLSGNVLSEDSEVDLEQELDALLSDQKVPEISQKLPEISDQQIPEITEQIPVHEIALPDAPKSEIKAPVIKKQMVEAT